MKTYKHLFEQLISPENIREAIKNAAKRKHNRPVVKEIFAHVDEHVAAIIKLLSEGGFKPQIHDIRIIRDGVKKKTREIVQPYFYRNKQGEPVYEQIIQHAVVQVLKPIIMKSMYFHSNGSVPDRGCVTGMLYVRKYIRKNRYNDNNHPIKYFIQGDIHHFYQSVDINILKNMWRKKIKDERFLQVLFAILDSNIGYMKRTKQFKDMNLPIGFYPSQWMANFYLQGFDHYVKEVLKAPFYSRYMDDFVIFHGNKKELNKMLDKVVEYLGGLKLQVKKSPRLSLFDYCGRGECVDFMGFRFYRHRTIIRKHILRSARQTALKVHSLVQQKKPINWLIATRMISYLGWFKRTDTYRYYEKYIKPYAHEKACKLVISQRTAALDRKAKGKKPKRHYNWMRRVAFMGSKLYKLQQETRRRREEEERKNGKHRMGKRRKSRKARRRRR